MGDTQPRTFKLSPSALLSFPRRLCNPPPSVGKVRSCSATAVVDVTLDDVLDRKHLPPLGLKDFEEWLLFVEQNAENLYFILWLREYSARYSHWLNNTRALPKANPSHPYRSTSQLPSSIKTNRSLAVFYSRAKQTFFTPNSPYELDLPSDVLGPFHAPSLSSDSLSHPQNRDFSPSTGTLSPHPDPAVFSEVENQVRSMLRESLSRFANSTISNVGTTRATCGVVGGTLVALAGFLPPIAENFALSKNRWLRVLAFPGLWFGLAVIFASFHGVCMMIYVFGDLRQLRSFELVRPSISPPQRLRPLRIRPPPPEPEQWLTPIRRPPIIPKPVYDPEKTSSPVPANPKRFLTPIPEPVSSSPSPRFSSNNRLRIDTSNPRVTLSSVCSGSFTSCNSDASHTSTTSSDEVEIHISEAFYDAEPSYLTDDLSSSPVPSSWQGESPSNSPSTWVPPRRSYITDSVLAPSPADNAFRLSNPRKSTPSDSVGEKWTPTAGFIRPFEYNEWEEWDGESLMYTTEGSLGGYGGGDEESRISRSTHPTGLTQDGPRSCGTRVSSQFLVGSRRGTVSSAKVSEELASFDFDALPAFRAAGPPAIVPALQRKPRYRTCDASPPPPLNDETSLTEAGGQEGVFRTWFVEVPKLFIRRMQGQCEAGKQVIRDVLSRRAREDADEGAYRDSPDTGDDKQCPPITGEACGVDSLPVLAARLPHPNHIGSKEKEKERLDAKPAKENWRARWKRVLTVPAFRSPLTRILSPVVTRAQWEVVVRSTVFSFVISFAIVAVLVAIPVP